MLKKNSLAITHCEGGRPAKLQARRGVVQIVLPGERVLDFCVCSEVLMEPQSVTHVAALAELALEPGVRTLELFQVGALAPELLSGVP